LAFKEHLINNQIRAQELRVIGAGGEQLGVMGLSQALKAADDAGLDLVLINAEGKPPVAKIIDYGKHKFETLRRERENKKQSRAQNKLKEVQLGLNTQENEIAFKMKNARGFLEGGSKVKIAITKIRGRQSMNADKGVATLLKIAEDHADVADIDQQPTKGGTPGRNMNITMILAPKKGGKKNA